MEATLTPEPLWRAAVRPLITTRGWTAVTHHLAGLPLGIAYFTWGSPPGSGSRSRCSASRS